MSFFNWSHNYNEMSCNRGVMLHSTIHMNKNDDSKSLIQTTSSVEVVHDQVQLSSSKPIINPWEEIQRNKNQCGLGYDKDDNNLHIPDYSKPINFISAGFLDQVTSTSHWKVEDKPTCKHFQRTCHMEDHCFDLHPCHHCHKQNHSSEKCCKQNQPTKLKINYAWIDPWEWPSTVKQLYNFYNIIQSHLLQPIIK